MSWILGFSGTRLVPALRERLAALHGPPLYQADGPAFYVAVGGLAETCHFGTLPGAAEGGWAVVGLGIRRHADHCTFLDAGAWDARLANPAPRFDDLDGHYVALRWQAGRVEGFTDATGTRTLYLASLADGTAFSTRLDWLAALRGGAEIDLEAFGAHWLTFNQLSTASLARGIRRLGPGGRFACTPRGLERLAEQPWTPEIDEAEGDGSAFARTLTALVHPRPADHRAVSLGLSGGLDSRLLLALRRGAAPLCTHVFGPPDHPDARLAGRMAEDGGLAHEHLHAPPPDAETCLALLRRHTARTQAVSAASSVLGLRYYPQLHAGHRMMIDGGLGEAARRQFMNRLLRRGRDALRRGDPAALLPYLRVARADVFAPEARAAMERGAQHQLEALWPTLPDLRTAGPENVVDVLGVRTRLPNFFGFEQNRLDELVLNYMPFAQPSLLRAVFHTPLRLRRGGRLFRRLIRTHWPALARYPLVKGAAAYPFRLSTLPAYLWTAAQKRLGRSYADPARQLFLETLKPFALDAVHSETVRTYAAYDHARLARLVEGYYAGRHDRAAAVDWWLAFETWRRALAGASAA